MGKPEMYKSALETTTEVWEYLADHPKIYDKRDLPKELWLQIRHSIGLCSLCNLFHPRSEWQEDTVCTNCPLYEAGEGCLREGEIEEPPYLKWLSATENQTDKRAESAQQIVDICKKAYKELS